MLRIFPGIAALASLSACAITSEPAPQRSAEAERPAQQRADGVTRVSLGRPLTDIQSRGPVGLAPCVRGKFYENTCWRKGDQHVLFPDAPPDELMANPAASDAE